MSTRALSSIREGRLCVLEPCGPGCPWICRANRWNVFAPHGAICAALLPHVMSMNLRALRQRAPDDNAVLWRYSEVTRLLTGNADATADDGVAWVCKSVADLQIPPLGEYGVNQEHVADLIAKVANAGSMKANPITLTADELAETLRAAI